MYNSKDIKFVGKYDFNKESAEMFASISEKSFSVNIFQWELKKIGKEMKPSKCIVRVTGSVDNKQKVFDQCEKIVNDLNNGILLKKKTVVVK